MNTTKKDTKKAIILLSGGLDSLTTLVLAQSTGYECSTLSFDYGQKHRAELDAAKNIAKKYGVSAHKIVRVNLADFGGSALTDDEIPVPVSPDIGIPVTYVPARNTIFLSLALAWAEVLQVSHIFIGVNAIDYSGYPDCRPAYIAAFEKMANLATKRGVEGHALHIETPLIQLTKAEIIQLGLSLSVDYSRSVSCYQADDLGRGCGACEACRLRRKGFNDAGVEDQTVYQ